MRPLESLDRRAFLLGATAMTVAAACGGGSSPASGAGESAPTTDFLLIRPGFADGLRAPAALVAGQPGRAPFVLIGGEALPAVDGVPELVGGSLTRPGGEVVDVELTKQIDGLAVPHYTLLFDAPEAGVYVLEAEVSGQSQRAEFRVAEPDEVRLVQIGDPLRPVDTPTFDDARGFDPICTRFEPCPFHDDNLPDIIGNGRPTALLIATPAWCQTASCGPVVDLLVELDPSTSMNVIHAEVYTTPDLLDETPDRTELLGPIIGTYGMDFEPSLIVADREGIVTARLDFSFDRSEMAAALATAS